MVWAAVCVVLVPACASDVSMTSVCCGGCRVSVGVMYCGRVVVSYIFWHGTHFYDRVRVLVWVD